VIADRSQEREFGVGRDREGSGKIGGDLGVAFSRGTSGARKFSENFYPSNGRRGGEGVIPTASSPSPSPRPLPRPLFSVPPKSYSSRL